MKAQIMTICLIVVLIANSALAATYYVFEEEDGTIQDAINACVDHDTVVIAPGTYKGSGNCGINFNGKAITVRGTNPADYQVVSATIIDCEENARGFVFNTWETADSRVAGLTIINGNGLVGGAIYSYNNSSPTISNCVIRNNSAIFGGGIACTNGKSYPVISNCQIIANSAQFGGGGVYLNGSSPVIRNCIISGNVAPDGGAIYSHNEGSPLITNCTISVNQATNSGGAIYCYKSSSPITSHSILWGNIAPIGPEIFVGNLGAETSIRILYCDVQGGESSIILDTDCSVSWEQGNIDIEPQFVEAGHIGNSRNYVEGDYHLLEESLCIDAGDPGFVAGPSVTDIDGERRVAGAKIDLGADEFIPPIPAFVRVMPRTLNLQSNGQWVSCTVKIPDEYSIYDVDTETIALNKEIKPAWYKTNEEDNKLLIKLDRYDTQQLLKDLEGLVPVTVRGELIDGTKIKGSDEITVIKGEQ